MSQLAEKISEAVESGYTLRQEVSPELWNELQRLGGHGAEIQPDTSAVIIRMNGFPRNYGYAYRLAENSAEWTRKAKRLGLQPVGGHWYWYECHWGRAAPGYLC